MTAAELLNMAWSNHEISGDFASAILVWLEGGGQGDLQQLAEVRLAVGLRLVGGWHNSWRCTAMRRCGEPCAMCCATLRCAR